MANPQHLAILENGVKAWNLWRHETKAKPDLRGADLSQICLRDQQHPRPDFADANFNGVNLENANLENAMLFYADFAMARLRGASFRGAHLEGARFQARILRSHYDLGWYWENRANYLLNADFSNACFAGTVMIGVDLSAASGIETIVHRMPSFIDIETLAFSKGAIPEEFLAGCGMPSILFALQPTLSVECKRPHTIESE